jgi:hypothetical protein
MMRINRKSKDSGLPDPESIGRDLSYFFRVAHSRGAQHGYRASEAQKQNFSPEMP